MRAAHLFFPKPRETEQVEEETMMTQFEKGSRRFHYATFWNELVISSLLIPYLVSDLSGNTKGTFPWFMFSLSVCKEELILFIFSTKYVWHNAGSLQ